MHRTRDGGARQDSLALQAALTYASLGWRVVPVWRALDGVCTCRKAGRCDRPGKHPRTPHGHKAATTDPKKIRTWKWKTANVGIATGRESALLVLDIDPRNGGLDGMAALQKELGRLPSGPVVETGRGGLHLYFRHPDAEIRKFLEADGVDIKADGGFVVAPPSNHASGSGYGWEVPPTEATLPDLPEEWDRWLKNGECYSSDSSYPSNPSNPEDSECYSSDSSYPSNPSNPSNPSQTQLVLAPGRQQVDDRQFPVLDEYVEEAVKATLPPGIGWRRKCLWGFLVKLKQHPELRDKPVRTVRPYVRRWHQRALPTIGTRPFASTWDDAVGAWDRVDPDYQSEMGAIVWRAFTSDPPALVADLDYADDPITVALVCLFREMQRAQGTGPFWISCERAARIISEQGTPANKMTVSRRIRMLMADEVIIRVTVGSPDENKCSEYRYLYPLCE